MLTYRVRPRVIKFEKGAKIYTPALAEVTFVFEPAQAFGAKATGGRTSIRGAAATMVFDIQTGQYFIESATPLTSLNLVIEKNNSRVTIVGNKLTITKTVTSELELSDLLETVYYFFPLLLATNFADPPIITNVTGTVNGIAFQWNLANWQAQLLTTTQEKQTQCIATAWQRLEACAAGQNRRLVAALHYFHVASRLDRVSAVPGEFLAEALLNYCKILEVLFSPSTETVRKFLPSFGFSNDEIERDFIPAILLRSKIDIAHVSLVLFTPEQLSVLHRYADRAENQFRLLLSRALDQLDKGTLCLPEFEVHAADSEITHIIERMDSALAVLGNRP